MPTHKLVVVVEQARNLPARDFNGFSDPYVTVKIKGGQYSQEQKTKVIDKNLNPIWNESFTFLLNDNDYQYANLQFKVWDKDNIGSDFIGELIIPLYKITGDFQEATAEWHPLTDKAGNEKGKLGELSIRVGMAFDSLPDTSQDRVNQLIASASLHDTPPTNETAFAHEHVSGANVRSIDGLLQFEVLRAKNLPNNGSEFVSFNMDSFFVVSFGVNTFRSRVIKHNLNPEWDDRVLLLVRENERNYDIKISIYDHDTVGPNSLVGSALLRASTFTAKSSEIEKSLKLDLARPVEPNLTSIDVRGKFVSYHDLKKQFWSRLADMYDSDKNHKTNRVELGAILDSLGTTIDENKIEQIMKKYGTPSAEDKNELEISSEDLVSVMDDIAKTPGQSLIGLERNPFNGKPLPKNQEEALLQLAISHAEDFSKIDQFVTGGLITEAYASKGWFNHVVNYLSFGKHQLGAQNANILVQDRRSGLVEEEKIPTFVRLGIRVLYQQSIRGGLNSKAVRNLFLNQSIRQGKEYDDPKSASHIMPFVKFHNLKLYENLEDDLSKFKNFNEFFYRKLKPSARAPASDDPNVFISPADCRMSAFPTISLATELWIKGKDFTLKNLFGGDDQLAQEFEGGSLCIFRLAPQDYHRYHSPCNGNFKKLRETGQHLFTVNPMAVRENFPVYTENKRYVTVIDSKEFGKVAYMIIGAMLVGSIILTVKDEQQVQRFQELGYFKFGGSTIICVFRKDAIVLDEDLVANSAQKMETRLLVGDRVGIKK